MLQRNWVCYTDAPPLLEGGHGNHGIAVQILKSIGEDFALILTRKFRRSISRKSIYEASAAKQLILHPDASGYGIKKISPLLGSILDLLFFTVWIFFSNDIRSKYKDWFILCGADYWFLLHILVLQKLGISTHIYLVDEIEASAKHKQPKCIRWLIKPTLNLVLKNSSSVFAISEGFVDYLKSEYQSNAKWLPIPCAHPPVAPAILPIQKKLIRKIVFIGALNHLYLSALNDLYKEISELNDISSHSLHWKLEVLSYCPPDALLSLLPDQKYLIFYQNLPAQERLQHMAQASACFLPYSFSENDRMMVSTSFSCKILEYFTSGSPILVYGPAYASIPRYFLKENLPICATNRAELRKALKNISNFQNLDYSLRYYSAWKRYHSPESFAGRVLCV